MTNIIYNTTLGLSCLILYLNHMYMERERTSGGPNSRLEVSLLLQLCIPGIQGIFLALRFRICHWKVDIGMT